MSFVFIRNDRSFRRNPITIISRKEEERKCYMSIKVYKLSDVCITQIARLTREV